MIKRNRRFLLLLLLIIGLLSFVSRLAQQQIEFDLSEDIGAALQTVLDTTHQAIQTWVKAEQASAIILADTPVVRQFAKELLETPHTPAALNLAPAQAGLRKLLQPIIRTKKYHGYFILSKKGVSLASSRSENIGTTNLLISQQLFLNKILSGKSAISLPQASDVPLINKDGRLQSNLATMFVGAPILDDKHNVLAIFLFRIDPNEDFTAIFQRGRIGESGETYAFNRMGQMISNSRFESQLRSLGMLQLAQHSILNIQIRNPGFHLLNSQKLLSTKSEQALTSMASQAITGISGRNLEGYRDYRGIPVIGAWLWDSELNFGITTEIDKDEAYATLSSVQYIVYTLAVLSILLLSALGLYFMKSRERILESERQFRRIVDGSPYPVVVTDPVGNIEHINSKFIELFGWTTDDVRTPEQWWLASYPDAVYRKKVQTEWESAREKALETGSEIEPQQWKLTCKNGDVREVEFRMMPVSKEHNVIALQDLTERLKAENEKEKMQRQLLQSQKMEAIGQMTGGIAHDFNNMLASISGHTELAKEAVLAEEYAKLPDYLDEVLSSSERASDLVAMMLAYSRGTKKALSLQPMVPIVLDSLSMLKSILPSSIVINTEFDEGLPDIMADAVQLHQVLVNLCVNARDSMNGKGNIDVRLHLTQLTSTVCHSCHEGFDGNYLELSVSDTGGGINDDVLDRIFDPFFTTKAVGKGSGMGLPMVHGVVHDHNGHILVENHPGKGTTFRIFFSCD